MQGSGEKVDFLGGVHTVRAPGFVLVLNDDLAEASRMAVAIVVHNSLPYVKGCLANKVLQLLPPALWGNLGIVLVESLYW